MTSRVVKRALVTGAGRRLGAAMARHLGRQGFDVAVHYAGSVDGAQDVVSNIKTLGQNAVAIQADLLDVDAPASLFKQATDALGGPITCLINNASIFEYDRIDTADLNSWDRHMASNLRAPMFLTQAMAAQGLEATVVRGEPEAVGLVINMVDQRVRKLTPEFMTYTLAKAGLWTLTQTTARGLAPHIRVNAIGPGPTLQGDRQSETHFQNQRKATILGRGADATDVVAALDYFLNASSVTGQLLCVDGGQHLGWKTPDIQGIK